MRENTRGGMASPEVGATVEEIPSRNLPPVTYQDLPEALPLRKVSGPGVVSIGIGLSSGKLIVRPYITSQVGLVFLRAAVIGILTQFFLNMDINATVGRRARSHHWLLALLEAVGHRVLLVRDRPECLSRGGDERCYAADLRARFRQSNGDSHRLARHALPRQPRPGEHHLSRRDRRLELEAGPDDGSRAESPRKRVGGRERPHRRVRG